MQTKVMAIMKLLPEVVRQSVQLRCSCGTFAEVKNAVDKYDHEAESLLEVRDFHPRFADDCLRRLSQPFRASLSQNQRADSSRRSNLFPYLCRVLSVCSLDKFRLYGFLVS